MTTPSLPEAAAPPVPPSAPPPVPAASAPPWARLLRAPVAPETWRGLSALLVGGVVLWVPFAVVLVLLAASLGLAIVWLGIPLLVGTLLTTSVVARVERARLRAALGLAVAGPEYRRAPRGAGLHRRMFAVIRDGRRWREVAYVLAAAPLSTLAAALVLALAAGGLALLPVPWVVHADLPALVRLLAVPAGLAALYLAAAAAQAGAWALGRAAAVSLGQGRAEVLTRRVEELTTSRTEMVSAADDERRRIERDLHDGAQQRLVALSVELGLAKRGATADPSAAAALDHAQTEVRETLRELRDVIRGAHPAVLSDRGFDAALSALAARCPVPVTVRVADPEVVEGLPVPVQTAAYYVVAETLTNLTRHSGATSATLTAECLGPVLRLRVTDDGHGGAREVPGGGLAGLRSRVEALDGTFRLVSAAGQGTSIEVALPCAS